jgi:transposase
MLDVEDRAAVRPRTGTENIDAVKGILLDSEVASYQQVADKLGLSLGTIKTVIHRMRNRYRTLLRKFTKCRTNVANPTRPRCYSY